MKSELFHGEGAFHSTNYFCDFSVSYKTSRWEFSLMTNTILLFLPFAVDA